MLSVVQRLLVREMRRQNLSLRKAADLGRIAVGSLSFHLDASRISDPVKQPKRKLRRATLLLLRDMPWIGPLTRKMFDRLLGAADVRAKRGRRR